MAVEANEGGGAGTDGEPLSRAEMEMKKEREIGGEIEHIPCHDGDDNDGSGTDGSFVMVMNGGDSDAISDSSEKDLDRDVRCGKRGAGDLLSSNSGSTFVDDVRVDEGESDNGVERRGNEGEEERKLMKSFSAENEGKGDDDAGGREDDAHDGGVSERFLVMSVELEEVIDESARTDHALKEEEAVESKDSKIDEEHVEDEMVVEVSNDGKQNPVEEGLVAFEGSNCDKDAIIEEIDNKDEAVGLEDSKIEKSDQLVDKVVMVDDSNYEKVTVIETLNNDDEAIAADDLKNEIEGEVATVADSYCEKEMVIDYLNKEDELIMGTEGQVFEGTEVPNVQNEVGTNYDGLTIGASSAQSSSSGLVDRNNKSEFVFNKSDAVVSAVTKHLNKDVESVSQIEETKKPTEQKIIYIESSLNEKKEADSASETEDKSDVNNEVPVEIDSSELRNEEISSVFKVEDWQTDNHEESKDVDSFVSVSANKGVASKSEVEEIKNANDEEMKDAESSKQKITSVLEVEDRKNVNHEECEDVDSLVRDAAKKKVESNFEVEGSNNANNESTGDVESEFTNHRGDEVDSASEMVDGKIVNDDLSTCVDCENENISVINVDDNQQIKATPAVSDGEGRELNTSVEQVKQHSVNNSLQKSEIEEKEHDSSIELIDEPVKKDSCATPIEEEYHAAEGSSISQSSEPARDIVSSTSLGEDENDEALCTSLNQEPSNKEWVSAPEADKDKNAEMLFIASNPGLTEGMDLAPMVEQKQDLDASLIDSNSEPIRFFTSTSEVGEIQDAMSNYSVPERIKDDVSSASKLEEDQNVKALVTDGENEKRELKSSTVLTDVTPKLVNAQKGIEDKRKDLIVEEQDVDSSGTEIANEKREPEVDAELTEHMKVHPEKNLGEIEEQHNQLKAGEKQDVLHIQQQQGNVAPSASDGDVEKTEIPAKKYRLIKIPRFTQRVINDENQAKITAAQEQVDEHTRMRDSLKAELDNMRKVLSECYHKRDSANEEEKKAKALVNAKRPEIDSIQTVISKGKAAASFLDIISQIHTLEHNMQHETISLKDEKKCLHELNQLKHEREHHFFSKCSQLEIDDALKQKETAESSLRTLKKEFETLRSAHLKAEEYSKSVSKSYIDQFSKVKVHEQKWKAANDLRQKAYKNLHILKSDKMEQYWKYMDDRQAAKKYALSRDKEALERHCTEQVERIMKLWNEDDDFRKHYVESNVNNILWKFGTLDGRTRGPIDPKPLLPSHVSPLLTRRISPAPVTISVEQSLHSHEVTKSALPTNLMVRSKLTSESTSNNGAVVTASSREEFVEMEAEKKLTKEEEEQAWLADEQARKEEELRKVREELELKEKLRMEQKAKAKEAEERKRRKAEKAQVKAEYRAQKEAELRELKRTKKEKKNEGTSEEAGCVEGDPATITETSLQEAFHDHEKSNRTSSKKSRKKSSAALNKYSTKAQPVPLPLRNKGKRKLSTWIWTLCVAVALISLFFAANYISFSFSRLNFGF